ncbi:hypothetical protein NQ176_g5053 [Zarea fungicola]|uniref:Uncharacterized protein n=1 Tax=Zarea fungicola TaxID=93591 RepID=A0ACC1NBN7_9HYPO|nr:hypothetical protein NQ176_g5053 [Lecanicillium fungicola]
MNTITDEYILARDLSGSIRLDAQHLLWRLYNGYTMNPKIPISSDMKIAEIGTGTGLWLLDLASQVPPTVQLDGYDLSSSQFPHKSILPHNVTFSILDAFGDVPAELVGKYDVVHMRFWCCIVKGNDPTKLIRHAAALLKPGGYLQWEEPDVLKTVKVGQAADALWAVTHATLAACNIRFDWIGDLNKHVAQAGFSVLHGGTGTMPPALIPLTTNTYLAGLAEIFPIADKLLDPAIPSEAECLKLLSSMIAETKNGAMHHWLPAVLLAQKCPAQ